MKEAVLDRDVCSGSKSETFEGDCSGYESSEAVKENDTEDRQTDESRPSRDYLVLEHLSSCGLVIAS